MLNLQRQFSVFRHLASGQVALVLNTLGLSGIAGALQQQAVVLDTLPAECRLIIALPCNFLQTLSE